MVSGELMAVQAWAHSSFSTISLIDKNSLIVYYKNKQHMFLGPTVRLSID